MDKLLTIVVPVYNTQKYLAKCLDSLIVPDFMTRLDIIVVIDGSPDNSYDLAKTYESKYPDTFRVINKKNGGHGSCCNVGLKEARGKYIHFLDSDDWFGATFLEFLCKLSKTNADVVFTKTVKEFVEEGKQETSQIPGGIKYDIEYPVENLDWRKMSLWLFSLAEGTYKTQILRSSDLHFREHASYDDTVLYLMGFVGIRTITFYDYPLYHYLLGRSDQSMNAQNRLRKISDIKNQAFDLYNLYRINKEKIHPAMRSFAVRILKININGFCYITLSLPKDKAIKELTVLDEMPEKDGDMRFLKFIVFKYKVLPRQVLLTWHRMTLNI